MFWAEPANIGTFAIRATVTKRLPGRARAILRGLRVSGMIPPKADPVLSLRAVLRGLRGSVLSPRRRFRYFSPEKALRACGSGIAPPKAVPVLSLRKSKLRGLRGSGIAPPKAVPVLSP